MFSPGSMFNNVPKVSKNIALFATKHSRQLSKICSLSMTLIFLLISSLKVFPSFTNFPQGDTLGNGIDVHRAMLSGGTVFTAIKLSIKHAIDLYFNFEGRWFSGLFYAFSPAQISFERFDFITGCLMTGLTIAGSFFFIWQICRAFKTQNRLILALAFIVSQTLFVGYIQEFNHWIGALVYVMPYALSLFVLGMLINLSTRRRKKVLNIVLLIVSLIAVSGTNQLHVLAIFTVLFILAIAKRTKFWIAIFIFYIPLSIISIFAPGNFSRRDAGSHDSLVYALFHDIIYFLTHNTIWTILTIPLLFIFISLLNNMRARLKGLSKSDKITFATIPLAYFAFCPFLGFYSNGRINYNMDNTLYYFWGIYLVFLCTLLPLEKIKSATILTLKTMLPAIGVGMIIVGFFFTTTFKGMLQILDGTEFANYQINSEVVERVRAGEPIQIKNISPTVWHHPLFVLEDIDEDGCAILTNYYTIQFARWFDVEPQDKPCLKAYR